MKLRGESGSMPARSSGGIVGKGGSSVNPVYKESFPPSSVKVIKGNTGPNKNFNELIRKGFNSDATNTALRRKSGELARTRASQVDVGKPSRTIKIKSNNL